MPFIWGAHDGEQYWTFDSTAEFIAWLRKQDCIAYAHNGGKFDFIYLLPYADEAERMKIIGGRIAQLRIGRAVLQDSFSIVPVPLRDIQKDDIDYKLMESDIRHLHMPEIIDYLKTDVRVLWLLVTAFRETAGKAITIAANAMQSCRRLGIDPGRTNVRFDRKFRPFFYGGRTQCFQPGTHRELSVIDIRSAYPFAMSHDHATGDIVDNFRSLDEIEPDAHGRAFITLTCDSDGAFPVRAEGGGIEFPRERRQYTVTGWEYLTALKWGLIKNVEIQNVAHFAAQINFATYVQKWFDHKERHRPRRTIEERAQYVIGKILMNSLYGKLAMNPLRYWDYMIQEPGTPVDSDNGWQLYQDFDGKEIHRRSVAWDIEFRHGKEWEKKPLFYNVATGASITGFTRAHLLDAQMTVGRERVIYCDTDSLCVKGYERPAGLDYSNRLGAWDCEFFADVGHFAGKKLYGLRSRDLFKNEKTGEMEHKFKIACKGSKLEFDHIFKLVNGETVRWDSDAPTFSLRSGGIKGFDGGKIIFDESKLFVGRNIRATSPIPGG